MRHRRENGSALIAVLCLVFTAGLLCSTVLALSKIGTFTVEAHVKLQRSGYQAEGALHRIQWLLAADTALYPNAAPEGTDYNEYEFDRYLPDGVIHTLDYYGETIRFTITDTVSGYDFSGENYKTALNLFATEDAEQDVLDLISILQNRIADYIDSDDSVADDDSREAGEYEMDGAWPLPRNAAFEYKEELLYLPDFAQLFPPDSDGRLSQIRLIPPENTVSLSGAPSLYAASREQIKLMTQLEDAEVDEIMEALKKWKQDRELLSETLDPETYAKITGFAGKWSGCCTVRIEAPADAPRPFRRLECSFQSFGIAGPENQILRYLQWSFF